MMDWVKQMGLSGMIDILLMSVLIYAFLVWFKKSAAASVLMGIVIVACLYLVIRYFNLQMTAALLERFFAVILIAVIVIFQEELRHFFERVAVFLSFKRRSPGQKSRLSFEEVEVLTRTLVDLARENIGALIVLKGRDLLGRHLEGGVDLNGRLSEPLLKSLFDPHSVGHDGAMILTGDKVEKFGCHLPLSKNLRKMGKGGTRHAAALGVSEVTDSLALVVSEERGTISAARGGDIRTVRDAEELGLILDGFYWEKSPGPKQASWKTFLKENSREKLIAIILSLGLWFVLFHGSQWTYQRYSIAVEYSELPAPWTIRQVEPRQVDVILRGPRQSFYLLNPAKIRLIVQPKLVQGKQSIHLSVEHLIVPDDLDLESVDPEWVSFWIGKGPADPPVK